ncbi:probable disease resistance protein At4g27220 [Alnus glutinosa]|uniref:probable disease resistance protein At4g27220 n=1 Tax=Alnus glutinosa TaxID=3517 RepID=UPI002D787DD8|nr:probable disease resistance protein At4g27220 [Alnus glutinosa]
MEILIAIGEKIIDYTVEPVTKWLCYSIHYSSNIESMKKQVEKLQNARKRVQHSVDEAIRNGEEIEDDVNTWLKKVDEITEETRKVLEGEEEAKTRCSNGACMNLKLRHQLSQKSEKIVKDIVEAQENGKFVSVSHRPATQGIETIGSMDYVDSESRMTTVNRLMEALRDDNIHMIGVWGMAGVGKSTLVREVAKQAIGKKLFDEMAMATVTRSPNLTEIQREIADCLHLKFDVESSVPGRATRLWDRLTRGKKILVILDDIWETINLKEIGIPSEGCKVLLTSRIQKVLSEDIHVQKDFVLKVLPEEEAWSLFEKMAGDCVKDPNLQSIAAEVAKECAGLPLALVTVSKALKNKESFEWEDALQLLRRPAPEHLNEMLSKIYSSIELSYKHLVSEEVQHVFLRCAEMDFLIDYRDLLKYCYGLGSFHSINTLGEARNRVYTIVQNLKYSCLLLDCPHSSKEFHMHMHDVVRDVAMLIATKEHNTIIVRDADRLKERLDVDVLKSCKELSVSGGDFHELPNEILECPELRLLFVYGGNRSLEIPDTFFQGMGRLKVLDFTRMQLSSLPSSIRLLRNLQTLCLDGCVLGDIAVIGELKNLVILSLMDSKFSHLPREIGLLTHLQLLDLNNCSKLEVIPPNVISSLVALEELYMGNTCVQWEAEGNASLVELNHLCHLSTLHIHIPDASNLPKGLAFDKLERYVILVGDVWDWSGRRGEASRTLKLKLNTSFQSEVEIKMLLKRLENLYLDELKGVQSVLHELDWEGFRQLKHLHIQNNPEIKYIINLMMSVVAFPALETFLLKNMTSLEEICHGQLPSLRSFGKLRVVKVEHCDKLKFVFSSSIARGLPQLEELEIRECSIMGAIVMKEDGGIEDQHTSLFPQLRHLALDRLPKLLGFLSTQNSLVSDAGEIISEGKPLDFHMPILHEQVVVFPNLEKLELFSIGLEDIQHNQHQATRFSCRLENIQSTSRFDNLLQLDVKGCGNIKCLLSFSTARRMVQLKHLHIVECKVMEEILLTEDLGVVGEIIPKELFPRLECLVLKMLPILKRFCEGSNIKFSYLKQLVIDNCPKLKTFISKHVSLGMTSSKEVKEMNVEESHSTTVQPLFNEEVNFPRLENLIISHMDDLKILWQNQFAIDSFCKLQSIKVEFCENLTNVFQSDMLARFQNLEELVVSDCGSLGDVFELQGLNVKETHAVTAIPLKLLHLARLPNMRHVWSKDPKPNFSFQNLKIVQVVRCRSLKSLFPASVATCPTQLEQLMITDCGVEEIVAGEETAQPINKFVFPRVVVLHLAVLPRLKWFYPGVHTSEWPMLKDMLVAWCPKVEIFASELSSFQESQLEIPIQQPFFLVGEVPFPSLEKLRISYMADLKILWHNQFTTVSFSKRPQIIKFEFCENLTVQETCVFTATQLKELYLEHLPKLKHIWNKDPQEIFSFQNSLAVHATGCERMESLFPGAEEDFPEIQEFEMDNYGVKKIVVRGLNSSGFPQAQEFIRQIGSC